MPTASRRTGSKRPAKLSSASVTNWFRQFLTVNDQSKQDAERAAELKDRLKDAVGELGDTDEKQNVWLDLAEPVEFKDHKGKVFVYTTLKRERRMTPAQPTPDPEKAEDLLREKKLWLTAAQEKVIRDLQTALPNVTISVDVDIDAVAALYFKNVITEKEYDAILVQQKETFAFIPSES
jgi:hypothetical protein